MAASPAWKVYDRHGTYQAACKEIEAAACLLNLYGEGATIRHQHGVVVWTEGAEYTLGADSYDAVAEVAYARIGSPLEPTESTTR